MPLRIALSMSSFNSEMPINLRITYSPVASKNILLAIPCSRDSSILLANTGNEKVNQETVKCSINLSAHYCCLWTSGFCGTTSIISCSLCNSIGICSKLSPHKKETEMEGTGRDGTWYPRDWRSICCSTTDLLHNLREIITA